MKRIVYILLLLNCSAGFCQDTSKVGKYVQYKYDNGSVSSEGIMVNGKPDGYWKTFYESKKIKSKGNRKNFELDSTWKFYNDTGRLVLEINYRQGKKNGYKTTYFLTEIVKENYVNNVKEGYTNYYYTDGKLKLSVKFVDGREQGFSREFAADGSVVALLEYKNGYLISKENVNRFDKDSLKEGKWVTFWDNGNLKTEGYYRSGIKNGYFKEYDKNGGLLNIYKYADGELQKDAAEIAKLDIKSEYYPNGKVKKIGSYKQNIPEGIFRSYDMNGKIIFGSVFHEGVIVGEGIVDEMGLKQGAWKDFYETGELKEIGKYKNGLKIGDWKFYYKNGKIEQTGTYLKNEKPDGEWIWYYDNDSIWKKETYTDGLENGPMIEYSDSGTVIAKGEYQDDLEEGPWIYNLGDTKMVGSYKEGKMDGTWKHYYDNGNLSFEGKFFEDNGNGKFTYYWDNGRVKEEGIYVMGKQEGNWCKYDYDGTLFLTTLYRNGIEIKFDGVRIKPPTIEN